MEDYYEINKGIIQSNLYLLMLKNNFINANYIITEHTIEEINKLLHSENDPLEALYHNDVLLHVYIEYISILMKDKVIKTILPSKTSHIWAIYNTHLKNKAGKIYGENIQVNYKKSILYIFHKKYLKVLD